MHSKQI